MFPSEMPLRRTCHLRFALLVQRRPWRAFGVSTDLTDTAFFLNYCIEFHTTDRPPLMKSLSYRRTWRLFSLFANTRALLEDARGRVSKGAPSCNRCGAGVQPSHASGSRHRPVPTRLARSTHSQGWETARACPTPALDSKLTKRYLLAGGAQYGCCVTSITPLATQLESLFGCFPSLPWELPLHTFVHFKMGVIRLFLLSL